MKLQLLTSSKNLSINHFVNIKLLGCEQADDKLLKKVKSVVKEIFQNQYNHSSLITTEIHLDVLKREDGSYVLSTKATAEHSISKKEELSDLDVKIIRSAKKTRPTLKRSIKEIFEGWQATWKDRNLIIRIICCLAIYPLTVLYSVFSPKVYDLAGVRKLGNPQDDGSLLTALEWTLEACDMNLQEDPHYCIGEEFTLVKQLEEAGKFGTTFQKAPSSIDFKTYAVKIIERWKKAQAAASGESVNLALFPTGYWQNDNDKKIFQPILLSFYCDAQGCLGLSEMSYGSKEKSVVRDFKWKDLKEEDLELLLRNLVYLSKKPCEISSSNPFLDLQDTIKLEYLTHQSADLLKHCQFLESLKEKLKGNQVKLNSSLVNKIENSNIHKTLDAKESHSENLSMDQFRQRLIMATGADPENDINKRPVERNEDPWDLLRKTISSQFPDLDYSDKLIFTSTVLTHRFEKILALLPYMSLAEKRQWLHILQQERSDFEHQLKMRFGKNNLAQDFGFEEDHPLKKLQVYFERTQKQVELLHLNSAEGKIERLAALNYPENRLGSLEIPLIQIAHTSERCSEFKSAGINSKDLLLIGKLKKGWAEPNQENLMETIETFETLIVRMDEFIDQKIFGNATELYRSMLPLIPTPKSPLWSLIVQSAKSGQSSALYDRLGNSLSYLMQYTWETKLKSWDLPLKPDEEVYLLNLQTSMIQLYQERREWARNLKKEKMDKEKVEKWKDVKNKEPLTYEDIACCDIPLFLNEDDLLKNDKEFEKTPHIYNMHDTDLLFRAPNNDPFLRCSLSPQLEQMMIEIRQYLSKMASPQEFKANRLHFSDKCSSEEGHKWDRKIRSISNTLRGVWEGYHNIGIYDLYTSLKQIVTLNSDVFDRSPPTSNNKGCYYPPAVSNLLRNQVMMISLRHPATGIGKPLGVKENFWAMISSRFRKGKGEVKNLLLSNAQENSSFLTSLGRLELTNSSNFKNFFTNHGGSQIFGIKELGGTVLNLEIGIDGVVGDYKSKYWANAKKKGKTDYFEMPPQDYLYRKPYLELMGSAYSLSTFVLFLESEENLLRLYLYGVPTLFSDGENKDKDKYSSVIADINNASKEFSTTPMENWFLQGLELAEGLGRENAWIGENAWIKDPTILLFSPKNVEEVFDLALQSPYLLDQEKVQQWMTLVCFRPHLIQLLLRQNPDYFIERAPKLKALIENSINNGHTQRVAFLLWISSSISNHAKIAYNSANENLSDEYENFGTTKELKKQTTVYSKNRNVPLVVCSKNLKVPKPDKQKLKTILSEIPTFDSILNIEIEKKTSQKIASKIMLEWFNAKEVKEKINIGSFVLHDLACQPNVEELIQSKTSEELAELFSIAAYLKMQHNALSTLPVLAQSSLSWFEERLIPTLFEKFMHSDSHQNSMLDLWISKKAGRPIFSKFWKHSIDHPFVYESPEGSKIDLKNIQILAIEGIEIPSEKSLLPSFILKHPDYTHLFGERNFEAECNRGARSGEFIYKFADEKGHAFRIIFNRESQTLVIDQQFSKEYTGFNQSTWHRFVKIPESRLMNEKDNKMMEPLEKMAQNIEKGIDGALKSIFGAIPGGQPLPV